MFKNPKKKKDKNKQIKVLIKVKRMSVEWLPTSAPFLGTKFMPVISSSFPRFRFNFCLMKNKSPS